MDAIEPVLVHVLSGVASGTMGAAGAAIWHRLRELARSHTGLDELPADPADVSPDQLASLAETLSELAYGDASFAAELRNLLGGTARGDVSNIVLGDVAGGTVVQARNVGDVNLG